MKPDASIRRRSLAKVLAGWVLLTALGLYVGTIFERLLVGALIECLKSDVNLLAARIVFAVAVGAAYGASIGVFQWIAIRKLFAKAFWWMIVSTVGFVPGPLLVVVLPDVGDVHVAHIINGGCLGVAQWLFLRKKVPWSMCWVLAVCVAYVLANYLGDMVTVGAEICIVTKGCIFGALTGIVLVCLQGSCRFKYKST